MICSVTTRHSNLDGCIGPWQLGPWACPLVLLDIPWPMVDVSCRYTRALTPSQSPVASPPCPTSYVPIDLPRCPQLGQTLLPNCRCKQLTDPAKCELCLVRNTENILGTFLLRASTPSHQTVWKKSLEIMRRVLYSFFAHRYSPRSLQKPFLEMR